MKRFAPRWLTLAGSLGSLGSLSLALVLPLALGACAAGTAGAAPAASATPLGQEFSLPVGASTLLANGWRLGFDGVGSDSRCPRGDRCITAGNATVRLWAQAPQQARQPLVLNTAGTPAQPSQQALAGDLKVDLLHLQPYPVSGRPLAPAAYVATLRVQRDAQPTTPAR